MPARTGLSGLITRLRVLCAAGTADQALASGGGTVIYWSDEQLQAELDLTRRAYFFLPLIAVPERQGSAAPTYEYAFPSSVGPFIEVGGADSGFAVRDANGGTVAGTAYTLNAEARRVRFLADQAGAAYYLDARSYNLYRAAASIWRQKAAFAAAGIDWRADNHDLRASQEYAHCTAQAAHFASLDGIQPAEFRRVDEG